MLAGWSGPDVGFVDYRGGAGASSRHPRPPREEQRVDGDPGDDDAEDGEPGHGASPTMIADSAMQAAMIAAVMLTMASANFTFLPILAYCSLSRRSRGSPIFGALSRTRTCIYRVETGCSVQLSYERVTCILAVPHSSSCAASRCG